MNGTKYMLDVGYAWSSLPLALHDFIATYFFCIPASITSCQYIKYDLKCTPA